MFTAFSCSDFVLAEFQLTGQHGGGQTTDKGHDSPSSEDPSNQRIGKCPHRYSAVESYIRGRAWQPLQLPLHRPRLQKTIGHHSAGRAGTARPGRQIGGNTMEGTFVKALILHPRRCFLFAFQVVHFQSTLPRLACVLHRGNAC